MLGTNQQTHLIFGGEISNNLSTRERMDEITEKLCDLSAIEGIKDRVKLISSSDESKDEFEAKWQEINTISKLRNNLYNKLFSDIEQQYSKNDGKILIQVPLSHAGDFIPQLIERKDNDDSKFSKLDIEYVIIDPASIEDISGDEETVRKLYQGYLDKIREADKFIQIVDTANGNETFVSDDTQKGKLRSIASDYQSELNIIGKEKQNRMRLYFPTQEMAKKESMSLQEFYELYERATSLDWNRIKEANEELADLLREYDSVNITGPGTNIEFDISGMGARNSVIQTNWPGSEVHTVPQRTGVNGTITYDNEVYIKMLGKSIPGIVFEFEEGKMIHFEILGIDDVEEKETISEELNKLFNEEEGNRYLGELAFGTNFFIPTGLKHPLIGEKALGMHMAFGKSYNYEGVDNGNNSTGGVETSFHWDAIKSMNDTSVVSFGKNGGESIEVMNNEIFNPEVLPKLSEYQSEVHTQNS